MGMTIKDFYPINKWTTDPKDPGQIIDESTGKKYSKKSPYEIRMDCLWVAAVINPIFNSVDVIRNVACRALKIVSLSHFWMEEEGETRYNLKNRLSKAGADFLRIVVAPLALIGIELSSIYGLARPYDGRKLYLSICAEYNRKARPA